MKYCNFHLDVNTLLVKKKKLKITFFYTTSWLQTCPTSTLALSEKKKIINSFT